MEPVIQQCDEMILVGLASEQLDIGTLWAQFMAREEQITQVIPGCGYEVHTASSDPDTRFECLVGVAVRAADAVPEGMVVRRIPAGTYAIFTHRLANGGYEGANPAMRAWLTDGPYRHLHNFSIQRFDERFKGGNSPDSEIDFLIPVSPR